MIGHIIGKRRSDKKSLNHLFFSLRKKLDPIRQMLSRYVPQLYAYSASSPTIDQSTSDKLDKLIGVWEGHKYFDDHCYKVTRKEAFAIRLTEQR